MHDGMQYDPIQGLRQGHELFKFGNPAIFKSLSAVSPRILKVGHNI